MLNLFLSILICVLIIFAIVLVMIAFLVFMAKNKLRKIAYKEAEARFKLMEVLYFKAKANQYSPQISLVHSDQYVNTLIDQNEVGGNHVFKD